MRLEPRVIRARRQSAREVFGERTIVRVFGWDLHHRLEGGDLDLSLEVQPGQATFGHERTVRELMSARWTRWRAAALHARAEPCPIHGIALRGVL